ncbi:MBL fold metallo-hydrolase [Corynebacterium sp. TAE3-ERU16]|uniref:MBL fold metallo-hydrolase n=1 Tax=Corynebacterium sp. TAE3-ERU16 TaxID=2849493 RepID=UPI001C486BED|nr:MBL fold metallo-hydrolase [Corynebacterium sp. TAE3-ERU16]MBV7292888.1 MBL fold metallo-hydrolase [Corynebacterium sp. TAE3-ERU16]
MENIWVENLQLPVGQGGFQAGRICRNYSSNSEHVGADYEQLFTWVYDCGSTATKPKCKKGKNTPEKWSRSKNIEQSINLLKETFCNTKLNPEINVLFLSHFDFDHISGLRQLREEFDIRSIVVAPYSRRDVLFSLLDLLERGERSIFTDGDFIHYCVDRSGWLREKIISREGSESDDSETVFTVADSNSDERNDDGFVKVDFDFTSGTVLSRKNLGESIGRSLKETGSATVLLSDARSKILTPLWSFFAFIEGRHKSSFEKMRSDDTKTKEFSNLLSELVELSHLNIAGSAIKTKIVDYLEEKEKVSVNKKTVHNEHSLIVLSFPLFTIAGVQLTSFARGGEERAGNIQHLISVGLASDDCYSNFDDKIEETYSDVLELFFPGAPVPASIFREMIAQKVVEFGVSGHPAQESDFEGWVVKNTMLLKPRSDDLGLSFLYTGDSNLGDDEKCKKLQESIISRLGSLKMSFEKNCLTGPMDVPANASVFVLDLPHHGARKDGCRELFTVFDPLVYFASFGIGNQHKHPSGELISDTSAGNKFYFPVTQESWFRLRSVSVSS